MYMDERKTVEDILSATLSSGASGVRWSLADNFRKGGFPALTLGHSERPEEPDVVVFENPKFAVIYVLANKQWNGAEFELFRKKAESFAWEHDAAAYFIELNLATD